MGTVWEDWGNHCTAAVYHCGAGAQRQATPTGSPLINVQTLRDAK